jgi:hypothetical protein
MHLTRRLAGLALGTRQVWNGMRLRVLRAMF